MDMRQKIGQLFLLGFQGDRLDPFHPLLTDIRERNLGGVILFDRCLATKKETNNIRSAGQVQALTASLQDQARTPLLIAIDQEGGKVRRLKPERGFPATASAAELGGLDDPVLTSIHALTTADTLQALGINLNLAPVVDVNVFADNPVIGRLERSFSPLANSVSLHAGHWIRAHRRRGMLSCLKHFPGHGSSRADSHLGFTDISDTWTTEELAPYITLIAAGLADAIMTGHLFHRGLDASLPATLSPAIVTNLLRQKLGFDGVIISDDLQMRAITDQYGIEEAAILALAAGVDLLVVGNNLVDDPLVLSRLIPAILQAIQDGRLAEERILQSWKRIQILKKKRGNNQETGHAERENKP